MTQEELKEHVRSWLSARLDKVYEGDIDDIMQLINTHVGEVIGEGQTQFLTKDKLQYQLGWCNGREELRAEQKERAGL